MSQPSSNSTNTVTYQISPPRSLVQINWAELWRYRELFYIFVWRDIKVRYKQTFFGAAWAVFQPFITMVIFTVIFGRLAKVPSGNAPYAIFVYTGLLFWTYYQTALTAAATCMVENEAIIKKVYFPRLILPISTTITPVIDFLVAFIIFLAITWFYHFNLHWMGLLLFPILLIFSIISAAGLGLFVSSLNIKYRDVRYVIPFFIQILLYLTPVIYSVTILPAKWRWILYLNPMTGVITVARNSTLGLAATNWHLILISVISSIVIFLIGLTYFRRTERFFADII